MSDKKKIMIVEDEQDILKMTVFRVKKAGYDVITAPDGAKALELAASEKPDMIFLDLGIPIYDGYEVCRRLKTDDELKKIPVVILTASSDSVEGKTQEIGADAYLLKPYELEDLLSTIARFTE